MSDIKTRDVTRGTIKTLDRAASSMHHLKEASIRSKAADISGQHDNEYSALRVPPIRNRIPPVAQSVPLTN